MSAQDELAKRRDVFLFQPEDVNTLPPFSAKSESFTNELLLGLRDHNKPQGSTDFGHHGSTSNVGSPTNGSPGPEGGGHNQSVMTHASEASCMLAARNKKLPWSSLMHQNALFHRVFANLFYLTLCVLFRSVQGQEQEQSLARRCRSCLVTNWQDYLLQVRGKILQRPVLELLPALLTQLIYRALLDSFELGPLGFIDAAQQVVRRIGIIVHFELTGFTPQPTTIHRVREQIFVTDLVKHPYADVTMGEAFLQETDKTELKFGTQETRPQEGGVLSDLLRTRQKKKEEKYSNILDPQLRTEAANRDKNEVDAVVENLSQSLSHVVAVENAIKGSYMMYSQQKKAQKKEAMDNKSKKGLLEDPSKKDANNRQSPASSLKGGSIKESGSPGGNSSGGEKGKIGGGSGIARLKKAAASKMTNIATTKIFSTQLDKNKYDKAVRTCIYRQRTLPSRYSRGENSQFNTSWLSPMVSHTALQCALERDAPIAFSERGIVGKTTRDSFQLRFRVAPKLLPPAGPHVAAPDDDDDQGAAGQKYPSRSPSPVGHEEARSAFTDFFRKKDVGKREEILEKRKPPVKLTVAIEPPVGVSKAVSSERLKIARTKSELNSWAHYIRTYDTSTGVPKGASDQAELFRAEKQYVSEMEKLTSRIVRWQEYDLPADKK
ncbi:unnamed protein product [Amoebophrya sp. A25]|nr:unnamed protein product [Amoebophrya sp. A25]|eukprot:GSA25T00010671001.1